MEWPRMVVRGTTSNHASVPVGRMGSTGDRAAREPRRSEEHTSELQSRLHLVCRLLLEKKKNNNHNVVNCPGPADRYEKPRQCGHSHLWPHRDALAGLCSYTWQAQHINTTPLSVVAVAD